MLLSPDSLFTFSLLSTEVILWYGMAISDNELAEI